jgi:hypothetical protein
MTLIGDTIPIDQSTIYARLSLGQARCQRTERSNPRSWISGIRGIPTEAGQSTGIHAM